MKRDDATLLKALITEHRVLSLAVVDDRTPILSMVPFVVESQFSSVLVHVSTLAPHGRALTDGAPFSILIHGADAGDQNPGEIPRVRFSGAAEHLARESGGYPAARELYLARFPDSAVTFSLGDFELYRLPLQSGRLVAGFARTVNLKPETLRQIVAFDFEV